jgi:pyridoxamine 5'-phosphate oxidase
MHDRDPIERFREAFTRALASEPFDAARAALATAGQDARPSVRFVLMKEFDARGFVFYSHAGSRKGREIAQNPSASLAFHWHTIGEQIRIEGQVERVCDAEADAYFATRPRGSQLGAWASAQSLPIASRAELEQRLDEYAQRFGDAQIARPSGWGGFRLVPSAIEFWYDRQDRLHDRVLYVRTGEGYERSLLSP